MVVRQRIRLRIRARWHRAFESSHTFARGEGILWRERQERQTFSRRPARNRQDERLGVGRLLAPQAGRNRTIAKMELREGCEQRRGGPCGGGFLSTVETTH